MREIFPIWFRVYAAMVLSIYLIFAGKITYDSWPLLTGEISTTLDVLRLTIWSIAVAGGALGAVSCIIFAHVMWWRQQQWKYIWQSFPSAPPPPDYDSRKL